MSNLPLNDRIELLAQDMATKYGVPIERARRMIQKAVYAPPTAEEIEDAIKELQEAT